MLPVDEVNIDPVNVNSVGLGKSIYTTKQLEEFAAFQDSQGTCKAYLAETAELAYMGRNEKGEWGLALVPRHSYPSSTWWAVLRCTPWWAP